MAAPTEAEIQATWADIADLYEKLLKAGDTDADSFVVKEDALIQALEGEGPFIERIKGAIGNSRRGMDALLRGADDPHRAIISAYIHHILNVPDQGIQGNLDRLEQHFVDNSLTVQRRNITFGSPAAGGGNVGDGVLNRLIKSKDDFDLEEVFLDAKEAKCVEDVGSGSVKHEEVFEFRGASFGPDTLKLDGSGLIARIQARSARQSRLTNPSFDVVSGTAPAITDLNGWTPASGGFTKLNQDTTFYRDFQGAPRNRSLNFIDNEKITQAITVRNTKLNARVPMYSQIAFNRNGSGVDGVLTMRIGSKTVTIPDLTLQAASGWVILRMVVGQDLWFDRFNETDLNFEIELSGRTTGTLLVDDFLFTEMDKFGGSWYALVGGATKFLRNDIFTWTDVLVGADAVIQKWLHRLYGRSLPSSGTPTFVDP